MIVKLHLKHNHPIIEQSFDSEDDVPKSVDGSISAPTSGDCVSTVKLLDPQKTIDDSSNVISPPQGSENEGILTY